MRTRLPLVLVGTLLAAGCFQTASKQPATVDEVPVTRRVPLFGLAGPVDVLLDEYGRPHVYGASKADLARVTGWLHAGDRFVEMDLERRFAGGTVAELV